MPRDLVLGNGVILVNLDRNLNIRDFYYPRVGLFNHVGGYRNRIGVWVDGRFSWLDDSWSVRMGYQPRSLITDSCAENGRLGIRLWFNDTVHPDMNVFLRRVSVENLYPEKREVRLFFNHDFRIYETDIGDTAFFHPFTGSMVHFKRDCYLLINGRTDDEGMYEYAAGVKEFGGAEGTWRDAEDGTLSMHPIEQGSVDSTVSFRVFVPGKGTETLDCWIAAGRSLDEVTSINAWLAGSSTEQLLEHSAKRWAGWLTAGSSAKTELPADLQALYERSLLTMVTQIDRSGGITAANDTDIMQTARAHYSYVWPRDGALVSRALDQSGHGEYARRFLTFCTGLHTHDRPYFLQKYSPDGTVGAGWHPWVAGEVAETPHQQDSTALVVWAAGKHFDLWKDKEFTGPIFQDMVVPIVDHMVESLDPATRLPRPSYDLWEERRGVHLWTCAAVFAALSAAVKMAMIFAPEKAGGYRKARSAFKKAVLENFFNSRLNRFVRSLMPTPDGSLEPDLKIDASMAGVFLFFLLPAADPRVVSTMHAIYDRLWVRTPVGGIARCEDDHYFQVTSDVSNVPGNPWIITTLWVAEWYTLVARCTRDLEPAMDLLRWTARHASEARMLPEQLHPYTGEPLSVMPLTWSHASFVSALLKYQARTREFSARKV